MGPFDGVMVKRRRRKTGAGVVRVRRQRPTVEPLHKTAPGYFRRPARNQRSEQFSVALSAFEGAILAESALTSTAAITQAWSDRLYQL